MVVKDEWENLVRENAQVLNIKATACMSRILKKEMTDDVSWLQVTLSCVLPLELRGRIAPLFGITQLNFFLLGR